MNRHRSLWFPAALALALAVTLPSAAGAAIRQASYSVKFHGTQITNWSYSYTATRIDCTTDYHGQGSERYDFGTSKSGVTVMIVNGRPIVEQSRNGMHVIREIDGQAAYVNGGAPHCAHTTYSVDASGCGTSSSTGVFLLSFKSSSVLQALLQSGSYYKQCPSAATGSTDSAGGHMLESAVGHLSVTSLLKANAKAVHAEKTIRTPINYGTTKIGEEVTTVRWTAHFRRVGRAR